MIKNENGKLRYFDKNGSEIHEGDHIRFSSGSIKEVYLTDHDELGIDATNPVWIMSGRAVPCEYGIYPLNSDDCEDCEVCSAE